MDSKHPIEAIYEDLEILNKLLYRNFNQHGKTSIFKCIKHIQYYFVKFDASLILNLLNVCETINQKVSSSEYKQKGNFSSKADGKVLQELLHDIPLVIECYALCGRKCLFVIEKLRHKMSQLVFLPLYTIFLFNIASITTHLIKIIQCLYSYYINFINKSKVILQEEVISSISPEIMDILVLLGCEKDAIKNFSNILVNTNNTGDNSAKVLLQMDKKNEIIMKEEVVEDTGIIVIPTLTSTISNNTKNTINVLSHSNSNNSIHSLSSSVKSNNINKHSNSNNTKSSMDIGSNKKLKMK